MKSLRSEIEEILQNWGDTIEWREKITDQILKLIEKRLPKKTRLRDLNTESHFHYGDGTNRRETEEQSFDIGWNSCLKEIKRLLK